MSTLFGIYNRSGRPVAPEICKQMHLAMSSWQPDQSGSWSDGPVALGHEMLWNTPQSKGEQLPTRQGHLVLTMDARLDNRQELSEQLGLLERPLSRIRDSEFILAAYGKWGVACPEYLVGDFAFVIWDIQQEHLFCARDHLGIKPFYYHVSELLFLFGNDLKGLVAHPAISTTLDDEAVANYIVNSLLTSATKTFFSALKKLPPAHTLTVSATAIQHRCYWRAEDAEVVKLPDAVAYAMKLRELLEQAVHDRLRSDYPITSHLSGGLDSSTIAVLAARKLREKDEKLLAFNWLHQPTASDDADHYEWSNSKTVAEAEGIDHSYVPISAEDIYHSMVTHNIAYGDSAGFWYEYPVREAAQKKGSRTILSGWGGDELSTYHGQAYLANMLRAGKLVTLWRVVHQRALKGKTYLRSLLGTVYHRIVLPFMPRGLYSLMPRSMGGGKSLKFIHPQFRPVMEKEQRKIPVLTMQPQTSIRAHMLAYLQNGHLQARVESWAASGLGNRLEYTYPLLDKRIVEFILGVPPEYFMAQGTGRYLFRAAVEGVLPDKVLWGNAKREKHRVERLIGLSVSAYALLMQELSAQAGLRSNYADVAMLAEILNAPLPMDLMDQIAIVSEAGIILSLLVCERDLDSSAA